MSHTRVLVTGAAGQLAQALIEEFGPDHDLVRAAHADLDIANERQVLTRLVALQPAVILNCAAYNKVDLAEDHAVAALDVNAFGVRSLARGAAQVGATLVHFSTDFVFNGTAAQPYTEEDRPNPGNVYGASKLLGEWFAREAPRHYVLRVESLFGGPKAISSIDRIVDAIIERREVRVFADRIVSPSYVVDVAMAARRLLERSLAFGLYHCVNLGHASWLELTREAVRLIGGDARVIPVRLADVALRARRPRFSALSNAKLAAAGIVMPDWQDALRRYVAARTGAALT